MNENKKITYLLIILNVLITIYGVLWYLQCCQLLHQGGGADEIGEELDTAAGVQQEVTAELGSAEDTAADITGAITESQGAVQQAGAAADRVEGQVQSSGELIADCQRILAEVRARGKTD